MYISMENCIESITCPECKQNLNIKNNEFYYDLCCQHCQKAIISCKKCGQQILFHIPTRPGSEKEKSILNLPSTEILRVITKTGIKKSLLKDQWLKLCQQSTGVHNYV